MNPDPKSGRQRMAGYAAKAWTWARTSGPQAGVEVLINFLAPFLIFKFAKPSLGEVYALMAASAPPIAWSIIEFIRRRRVDALSMLVIAGIVLSLLAFLGGGGARFLQLRERLVTAVIGLAFLGSAAIGKPLIYQLARARIKRQSPTELASFEARRESPGFRRTMMVMTLVWGVALVAEASVSAALVFLLTIPQYLLVSPIVGYSTLGAVTAWTYWYARSRILRAQAAEAAAASRPAATP